MVPGIINDFSLFYQFLSFVGRAERLREGVPPPGPQQADETQDEGGEEVLQPHLHGDAGV